MTKNLIDYNLLLSKAQTSGEIVSVFKRMSDDANNLQILPSKEYAGAFDLFFIGLEGIETSFLVFQEEKLAKRFMVNGSNENEVIYLVVESTIYFLPYATLQ